MRGRKAVDISGARFGRLIAIEIISRHAYAGTIWRCMCDCGQEQQASARSLRSGRVKSCGCLRSEVSRLNGLARERHGKKHTPTWRSWSAMRSRCRNREGWADRGIEVCARWESFEAFWEDMGERPAGATLGRIDNDGNYEPSNCRWESAKEQARNRRGNALVITERGHMTLAEYCERSGVSRNHARAMIDRGELVRAA